MKTPNWIMVTPLLVLVLAACNTQTPNATDADNTIRNEQDQNAGALTSEDQGGTEADREISANIRKSIVADDSLSLNAHNIKIITANQVGTLRGPVKSVQEKELIEAKAKEVAGDRSINNLLEVEVNP